MSPTPPGPSAGAAAPPARPSLRRALSGIGIALLLSPFLCHAASRHLGIRGWWLEAAFVISLALAVGAAVGLDLHHRSPALMGGLVLYLFFLVALLSPGPVPLRSKIAANEASAIRSLQEIAAAEEAYRAAFTPGAYGALSDLSTAHPIAEMPGRRAAFVDTLLGSGKKSGYSFSLAVGAPAGSRFRAGAHPVTPGKTGVRRFFVDASGIVRSSRFGPATSGDSPVE